jgi:parallel beta-helix repeat protein
VAKKHPNAADHNPGTDAYPFATINKAAILAEPGDTVLVYSGVYRERIAPARSGTAEQPILYRVAPQQQVYVKGSDLWNPAWEDMGDHIYYGALDPTAFETVLDPAYGFGEKKSIFNPYARALRKAPHGLKLSLGQLFVNGEQLLEVDRLEHLQRIPGSWMVREDRSGLMVHFPDSKAPQDVELIELTTRSRVFAPYQRGLSYIQIDGFHFEHGATNFPDLFWAKNGSPQAGIVGCRGGNHWTITNCTIRYGKSLGLDIGSEGPIDYDGLDQPPAEGSGYHLIRNNHISDNGCGGMAGINSHGTRIIGNIIERNNNLGYTSPEIGGIKLHFFIGGLIEGNLIQDNYAYGIWLDNEWHNSRVTRNVILANEKAGIFMELGYGPILIDNNVIGHTLAYSGFGLYSHDAAGITFAHNLVFFNAGFGLWAHVGTDRTKDLPYDEVAERVQIEASNWRVLNNLFIGNGAGSVAFPLEDDISDNNRSDYNVMTGGYDRITYETYAEHLDEPYFLINNNKGRTDASRIFDQLKHRDYAGDPVFPFLDLAQWRELTGNDKNSIFGKVLRPALAKERLQLSFYLDETVKEMACPQIEGLDVDFFGIDIPEQNPLPGPFQQLKFEAALQDRSNYLEFRGPYNGLRNPENLNIFMLYPFISPQSSKE